MTTATANPPPPTKKRAMTADEFWDFVHLRENEDRDFELIRGEVVEMSRPSRMHGFVAGNIGRILGNWTFATRLGYVVTNDSGVVLDPDTVVGPDVAYFTDALVTGEIPPKWGTVPPVLAVEVVSPNDRPGHLTAKVREYLSSGTKLVWIVDRESGQILVHRPDHPPETRSGDDIIAGGVDLLGFSARVSELFAMPFSVS